MGKALIIKGADFSANALNQWQDILVEQAGINIILSSENYGKNSEPTSLKASKRLRTVNNILIPANRGITLRGLLGLNSDKLALRVDWIAYQRNERNNIDNNVVGTASENISSNYFPLNIDGNNSVSIVNPYNQDLYFGIVFASGDTLENEISYIDYSPLNYIEMW